MSSQPTGSFVPLVVSFGCEARDKEPAGQLANNQARKLTLGKGPDVRIVNVTWADVAMRCSRIQFRILAKSICLRLAPMVKEMNCTQVYLFSQNSPLRFACKVYQTTV
jgi:hypothetical protein